MDFIAELSGELETLYRLAFALALGLLIGAERGWERREAGEGRRVAGFRTHGLLALTGGITALLAERFGSWGAASFGLALLGIMIVLTAGYRAETRRLEDVGITSLVAGVLSFLFGALAGIGEAAIAAPAAVLTALVLSFKPALHRGLAAISEKELKAGLILLLMTVVLLPILPNEGYGPYGALNPFEIWWMVVLISAISFAGYLAMKLAGARAGAMLTGLFAGLASSTALTLHFSRAARAGEAPPKILAGGILLACGTMFPRMLAVATLLNPALLSKLFLPALILGGVVFGFAAYHWAMLQNREGRQSAVVGNPLELKSALGFGVLLALVMLGGEALRDWAGDAGVLILAAASGIMDVDAITLSLARQDGAQLTLELAAAGIVLAASVNTAVKGAGAALIGGRVLVALVAVPLWIAALLGFVYVWWQTGAVF